MVDQYIPFILISALGTLLALFLAVLAIARRRTPLTGAFVAVLLAVCGWSLTILLTRLATEPATAVFWSQVTYAFVGAVAVAWLNLACKYAGRYRWVSLPRIVLYSLPLLVTVVLVAFNERFHQVWAELTFFQAGPFWYFQARYGLWFWLHTAYAYSLFVLGGVLVIVHVIRDQRIYRLQAISLVLGAALPLLWNIISVFHLLPGIKFDVTPLGFVLGGLFLSAGIFRFRIFELLPVARETLLENLVDGVVVLDNLDQIISINPAASWIFTRRQIDLVGQPFQLVFPGWRGYKWQVGGWSELALMDAGQQKWYEVSVTPLSLKGDRVLGRLVVLRDITRRKQDAEELKLHRDRLQALVEAQTESLRLEIDERRQAEENYKHERDILSSIMDTSPVGIMLLDQNLNMTFANQQVAETTGLTSEQLLRKVNQSGEWAIRDLEGRPLKRQSLKISQNLREGKPVKGLVLALETADRRHVVIEINATPMRDADGQLTGTVATVADITERIGAEKRLKHLATHDSLTTLPNRVYFQERLNHAVSEAGEEGNGLAVVFMDLDNFKSINDAFSHEKGDELLQIIAQRIRSCIRSSDTVSRHGGDEFVILLEHITRREDAELVVRKLLEQVAQPVQFEQVELVVTVSMGVAVYPDKGVSPGGVMQCADLAMYHAKKMGKNRYAFYTPEMAIRAFETLELASDLRRALTRGEFVLHYQPIISGTEGQIVALEALVRWQHPSLGLLLPGRFLELAEECGLINQLGEQLLHKACQQGLEWLRRSEACGRPPVRMQVNLARRQIHAGLARSVAQALEESGFPPHLLELELTEEMVYSELCGFKDLLEQVHGLGVRLAIDDFGSGQTSFSQLSTFPFDTVKIDRSLTEQLEEHPHTQVVVAGLVGIARQLGMEVVAEGVEQPGQLDFYRQCGCNLFQGWYYYQALEAEQVEKLLG